jgi:hypothetical protein
VFFGTGNDIPFQLGQEAIIGFDDFQVDGNALLDGGVIKPFDDSFPVLRFCNTSQGIG